jgi:tRNA-specific 2-thiouridylase
VYNAKFVATGHYVKTQISRELIANKTRIKLLRAKDADKDQSYFLWTLKQKDLEKLLFPVGDYVKDDVRKMAKKMGLPVFAKRDSQEVCFVGGDLKAFLGRWLNIKSGEIRDIKNKNVLGQHDGLAFYTLGQRRGMGLGGGKPYYVVRLDMRKNILWVTDNPEDKKLYRKDLIAKQVSWIAGEPVLPQKIEAKIRSTAPFAKAIIAHKSGNGRYKIIFDKPQRAVTPGQSVVFYKNDEVLGGGVIS